MIDYMDKLDPELDLMEHYIIEIVVELKHLGRIIEDILDKEDLRNRKAYPWYINEYPDKDKEKIALFQRNPEIFLQKH